MSRRLTLACLLAALLGGVAGVLALDRAFPPEIPAIATGLDIRDRDGATLALRPAAGGVWRLRATMSDVSPAFLSRLIATEDKRFWWHPGVDPLALSRALLQDLSAGRVVSGGSTLTMQVVRLLHPRPRTIRAKLIEAARALQLEAHLSKREILGLWLTLAPFGGNIEGVRAAAWAWCGTDARALDPVQAAFLVALPRRPEALRPDRHPGRAAVLRDRLLRAAGWSAPWPPAPTRRLSMPHLGGPVLDQAGAADQRMAGTVATTLDRSLQAALERLLADTLSAMPDRVSAAVLIADARTREILAAASGGSPDASLGASPDAGEARAGALDLTRALRSPGSAMKPFLYGLAFQDGILGPESSVDDLPRRFGGYAPEDFDRGFAGRVSAAEALRRSLNVPAVALMDRIGPLRFAAWLGGAGMAPKLPPGADPSLPLALGGAGIRLRDLAALYAALATDGSVAPLRLSGAAAPARPLLVPWAAAMVAEVLTQAIPDGGPRGVAWKTGTSWGGRDAWTAGFDARHVVVAWIGRPDGTPMPGATGRALALPLFARAYGLLVPAPRPEPAGFAASLAPRPRVDLRLLFPPTGAELAEDGPVVLRVMGGRRPMSFLVDGTRLAADPARREAAWLPPGPGFYRVTVLDADGQAVRAAVRVR